MPTSTRQNAQLFTGIFGEFVTASGADVGIGPYKVMHLFYTVYSHETLRVYTVLNRPTLHWMVRRSVCLRPSRASISAAAFS